MTGTATANPAGSRWRRGHRPGRPGCSAEPADTPPVELWRPHLDVSLPVLLDQGATRPGATPDRRPSGAGGRVACTASGPALDAAGFTEVHSPKLVESATESGANVFEVDYFGRPAYLAQSPQFYKQVMVGTPPAGLRGRSGVPGRAARHGAPSGGVRLAGRRARFHRGPPRGDRRACATSSRAWWRRSTRVPARRSSDWASRCPVVPDEIPVLHFRDALAIVGAPADEPDLAPGARARARRVGAGRARQRLRRRSRATRRRSGRSTATPTRPTPRWSQLLRPDLPGAGAGHAAPSGCTGTSTTTPRPCAEREVPGSPYASYLEAFRHGIPPHGGFAIGLERWTSRLTGAANVREVTLFPRDLNRLTP